MSHWSMSFYHNINDLQFRQAILSPASCTYRTLVPAISILLHQGVPLSNNRLEVLDAAVNALRNICEELGCEPARPANGESAYRTPLDIETTKNARLQEVGKHVDLPPSAGHIEREHDVEHPVIFVSACNVMHRYQHIEAIRLIHGQPSAEYAQRGSPTNTLLLVRHTTCMIVASAGTVTQSSHFGSTNQRLRRNRTTSRETGAPSLSGIASANAAFDSSRISGKSAPMLRVSCARTMGTWYRL